MAVENFESPYAIIIDTDSYTGNFERELCAYITGSVGECGVGESKAEDFSDEHPDSNLPDMTDNVPDDSGCYRPVSIYNDGDSYNSLIIFFQDAPNLEEIDLMVARTKEFFATFQKTVTLKSFRLISNKVVRQQSTLIDVTI